MKRTLMTAAVLLLPFLLPSVSGADVMLGQVQTFDDPNHHWVIGVGPGPAVPITLPLALGGPDGPTDPYLLINSTGGSGPMSRVSAQNFEEWSGNYIAAGVDALTMDVRNLGGSDLALRLLFVEFGMMGPVNAAFSSIAAIIPAASDWQTITFDVSPSDLTEVFGSALGALSNVSELRIFHNPAPFFAPGQIPPIVASVGIDNITAAAVPEPALLLLMGGALASFQVVRRRRRTR